MKTRHWSEQTRKMNAIPIIPDDAPSREPNSLQKKAQQHVGLVSPDLQSGHSMNHRANKESAILRTVSPSTNHTTMTPFKRAPVKSTSSSTLALASPLNSPFTSSMALLDSKLESIKKEDVALNDKIESMQAWLDESGMEDSFEGQLLFDDWDGDDVGDMVYSQIGKTILSDRECGDSCYSIANSYDAGNNEKVVATNPSATVKHNSQSDSFNNSQPIEQCEVSEKARLSHEFSNENFSPDLHEVESPHQIACRDENIQSRSGGDNPESTLINDVGVRNTNNDSCGESVSENQSTQCILRLSQVKEKGPIPNILQYEALSALTSPVDSKVPLVEPTSDDFARNPVNSIKQIGKVTHPVSSSHAKISSARINQTLFFSPVEACESQLYLTPFSRDKSLESSIGVNLFSAASNTSNRHEMRTVMIEKGIQNSLHSTIDSECPFTVAPSLCQNNTSTSRMVWIEQSSVKSEATQNLNQSISELEIDSSSDKVHLQKTTTLNHPDATDESSPPKSPEPTPKQNSSPIRPKQLYNIECHTESLSEKHKDHFNVSPDTPQITGAANYVDGADQEISTMIEPQCQPEGNFASVQTVSCEPHVNSFVGIEKTQIELKVLSPHEEVPTSNKVTSNGVEQELEELKSREECLVKQLEEVNAEKERMKVKLEVSDQTIQSLNQKVFSLENNKDDLLQKLNTVKLQLTDANDKIDLISGERLTQEDKIKELYSNLTSREAEKAVVEDSISELSATLNGLQQQIQQKDATIGSLSQTINSMKSKTSPTCGLLGDKETEVSPVTTFTANALDCREEYKTIVFENDHCSPINLFGHKFVASEEEDDQENSSHSSLVVENQKAIHSNNDRFRRIAAKLSVIVLQQKARLLRAKNQNQMNERHMISLQEQLANIELSLAELNTDRTKLAESVVELKNENDALTAKLNFMDANTCTSEALVLAGDCGVETINCTTYSYLQDNHTELEGPGCNQKLKCTIANLAVALVKLKGRELSLLKTKKKMEGNYDILQHTFESVKKQLADVINQKDSIRYDLYQFKNDIANEIRLGADHSSRALIEMSSIITNFQKEHNQLVLEKHHLQAQIVDLSENTAMLDMQARASASIINELQSQNAELLLEISNIRSTHILPHTSPDKISCKPSICATSSTSDDTARDLEQQVEILQTKLSKAKDDYTHSIRELKKCHERDAKKSAESIASLKSQADSMEQLKFDLLHEKETTSLLRNQVEKEMSQKDEMEASMTARVENLTESIVVLQAEKDSLTTKILQYEDTIADLSSKLVQSQDLRNQLQSQLDAETNSLRRTLASQEAKIDELNLAMQALTHQKDLDNKVLSTMHCKVISLTSERDNLLSQLSVATDEYGHLKSEYESLKHELSQSLSGFDTMECSVETFQHFGTVSEEESGATTSPPNDIIQILSSPKVSKKDIQTVSGKMRKLHSMMSQVQKERRLLKQEVKHLREFKASSSDRVSREEMDLLVTNITESYQNEISRLTRELESLQKPQRTNRFAPLGETTKEWNRPHCELSLETRRISNQTSKQPTKTSSLNYSSPQSPNPVRSNERFEIKKGHYSFFRKFRDTRKSGRKDSIKYRDVHVASQRMHDSSEGSISPGEKRKREQAERMIKSLRRKYEL